MTGTTDQQDEIASKVTALSAFKTSDGTIYEDHAAAVEHERKTVRQRKIVAFCDEHVCRDMLSDEVAKLLLEHRKLLLEILK